MNTYTAHEQQAAAQLQEMARYLASAYVEDAGDADAARLVILNIAAEREALQQGRKFPLDLLLRPAEGEVTHAPLTPLVFSHEPKE